MTQINLLPWREQLREELKRQFLFHIGLAVAAAISILLFVHFAISVRIQEQTNRNTLLQENINLLDKQIQEIDDLQKEKGQLLARMNIIQHLQSDRTEIVHIFDDLVRVVPNGVYLTSIKQESDKITLVGKAESNTRVSALMRNIEASDFLAMPALTEIKTEQMDSSQNANTLKVSNFILQLQQKAPDHDHDHKAPKGLFKIR